MPAISSRKTANLYPLLPVAAAFALGVWFDRVFEIDALMSVVAVGISAGSALFLRRGKVATFAVVIAFFFLGAFCLNREEGSIGADRIRSMIDDGAIASGAI